MDKLSYLAGLVDGEGFVGYSSDGKGKQVFMIKIKMTSEPVIDWLMAHYPGTKVFQPSTNPKWKDQFSWKVRGKKAIALYRQLQPMLLVKGDLQV